MTTTPPDLDPRRLAGLSFLVSAGVLAFEIVLMRLLLVASWHHFAFLVISVVLLGFGASGTALTFGQDHVRRQPAGVLFALALATAVAMPLCAALAWRLPVEGRVLPGFLWRHLGLWVAFWGTLTLPFLLGGATLGAALMVARSRLAGVYAANLLGSAVGAITAPVLMTLLAPAWLPAAAAAPALAGAVLLVRRLDRRRGAALALTGAALALLLLPRPRDVRLDPYKDGAALAQLAAQGTVERVAARAGSRAQLEAYRGPTLHDLPFLGVGAVPPPITVLLADGHRLGSILDVASGDAAEVVDHTLMAAGYALGPPPTRVLLLDEVGGANVWLARRNGATRIDVVQPDPNVVRLLRGPLRAVGGHVLDAPGVRVVTAEPRHVVDHARTKYDVIQLSGLESSAAGGAGGLAADHLLTVEGLAAAIGCLDRGGRLFVCRGMQTPPRDHPRLLATLIAALRRRGVADPSRHLVVLRDYLAVCVVVLETPLADADVAAIRAVCRTRQLTPVWFRGIRPEELNRPDALPTPPGEAGDWYHVATRELLSERAASFIDGWAFDVRPPRDTRPYFHDFCRMRHLGVFRRVFGDAWLARAELAYPFVLVTLVVIGVVAAALILAPLRRLPRTATGAARAVTAGYFFAIGLGYLVLEMTYLASMTRLLGDAVVAAAVTIGGFLVASGVGSLVAQLHPDAVDRALGRTLGAIVVTGALGLLVLTAATPVIGAWPVTARAGAAFAVLAPPAFLMGIPMPTALRRLDRATPDLVPWAWGVNGFASVLAAPLAAVIAMSAGLHAAAITALAGYAAGALVAHRLPTSLPSGSGPVGPPRRSHNV